MYVLQSKRTGRGAQQLLYSPCGLGLGHLMFKSLKLGAVALKKECLSRLSTLLCGPWIFNGS